MPRRCVQPLNVLRSEPRPSILSNLLAAQERRQRPWKPCRARTGNLARLVSKRFRDRNWPDRLSADSGGALKLIFAAALFNDSGRKSAREPSVHLRLRLVHHAAGSPAAVTGGHRYTTELSTSAIDLAAFQATSSCPLLGQCTMSGNPRDIRRANSCRFTDEGVHSSANGDEGRFEVLDLQIALAMAQMPLEGVPARLPSSWCVSPLKTLAACRVRPIFHIICSRYRECCTTAQRLLPHSLREAYSTA